MRHFDVPIFAPRVDGLTPWLAQWVGANAERVSFIAIGHQGRLSAVLDGEGTAATLRRELLETLPDVTIIDASAAKIPNPTEGWTRVYAPLGALESKPLWLPWGITNWVGTNKRAAPEAGFRTLVIPNGASVATFSYGVRVAIRESATPGGPRGHAFDSLNKLLKAMRVPNCWVAYPGQQFEVDKVTF